MTAQRGVWGLVVLLSLPMCALAEPEAAAVEAKWKSLAAPEVLDSANVSAARQSIQQRSALRTKDIELLGFRDDEAVCVAPPQQPSAIDMHRSLMVHDLATFTTGNFTLQRTLEKLSADVSSKVPGTTPITIFRQLWDTQAAAPGLDASNPHCSDNDGKIDAFPLNRCPRQELKEALGADHIITKRIEGYRPLALVNRLDLAGKGWKSCGEHRIIYGAVEGGQRNFIIFEAVLPNPKPGCRSGCRGVMDFWAELSNNTDVADRTRQLEEFFYFGIPGFRPVVHTDHFSSGVAGDMGSSGSGQIRTNQFLNNEPWTLKEFKTLLTCAGGVCDYDLMPISVKVNPYGPLWSRDVADGIPPLTPPANAFSTAPIANLEKLAADFQAEVLAQVTTERLGNPKLNDFTYEVALDKNAAESESQFSSIDNYRDQTINSKNFDFVEALNAAGKTVLPNLTAKQLVNRAFAHSCAGCHQPQGLGLTDPDAVGPGMRWPAALNFVHVDIEVKNFHGIDGFDSSNFGGKVEARNISPALLKAFLPSRRDFLVRNLKEQICDCELDEALVPQALLNNVKVAEEQARKSLLESLEDVGKIPSSEGESRLRASQAALRSVDAARSDAFEQLGLNTGPLPLAPRVISLSAQPLTEEAFSKKKREALEEILEDEEPRQTVTGSFRSH